MSIVALILLLALQGLIVGAFARLALPGKDPLSLFETMAVGIMYLIRRSRGGGLTQPSGDEPPRR
jgi:hypothetical protein